MNHARPSRLLAACLLGAFGTLATAPRSQLPDGAKLLDEVNQETEGKKTIDEVKSLEMSGTNSFRLLMANTDDATKGTFAEYYQGDKVYSVSNFPSFGKMEEGTDGKVTWAIDPMSGALIRKGDDAAVMQSIWGLTRGDDWRSLFAKARCTDTTKIEGRPCYVVEMTPKSGEPMTIYVDRDKKLVVGVDVKMPTPGGKETVEVRVKSWKTVDGIVYPATTEIHTPHVALEFNYDKIVHNAKITASRFELPEPIQELVDTKKEPANDLDVQFRELSKRHVASVRVKVKPEHIGQTLAQILPEVMGYLTELGITPPAPPFTRYYSMSADEVDMEAGFPVPEPIVGRGRIKPSTLPGGKVAEAWHYGHYNDISKTYKAVEAWLKKQPDLKLGGAQWEVYWTDPGREPDVSKWRTQLFWTVK